MRAGFSDETQHLRGVLVPEYLFRENVRMTRHEPQTTETQLGPPAVRLPSAQRNDGSNPCPNCDSIRYDDAGRS